MKAIKSAELTTEQINAKLQVVSTAGLSFGNKLVNVRIKNGYALFHEDLGYLSFKGCATELSMWVQVPYSPAGGRRALQAIVDAGGMLEYDEIEWLQPLT